MKLEDFTERFNQMVGNNRSEFAFKVLIPYTTISNVQKGTDPRVSLVLTILEACPEISAEWLMRGRGKMNGEENRETTHNEELLELTEKYMTLRSMYDEKCVECAQLRTHVAELVARNKETELND